MTPIVDASALTVGFRRGHRTRKAVDDASFRIETGETFGLTGPSGCGKSTVLRVLAGLQREWSGDLTLFGRTIRPGSRFTGELRRNVQMVFQDPMGSLHPNHTIRRALSEPLTILGERDPRPRMESAMSDVGLSPDMAERYPHQLSGGQRQRVCIARALLPHPRLLLLDEPTSALDTSVQAEILNLLCDLKAAYGMTLVLVSHDADVIAHMCDRAVAMTDGHIAAGAAPSPREGLRALPPFRI